MSKTTTCGELSAADGGRSVTLIGWVNRRRDHGDLIFVDLRDRWGITQVVFDPEDSVAAWQQAREVRSEYVLAVTGDVARRLPGKENPHLATGAIELRARELEILNPAETPPFVINEEVPVEEALRLRYRYLDLRRPRMTRNILLRHRVIKFMRDWLDARDFIEIETPILFKSTPGGARDYLVPSRLHPGCFYALPQSPQQFKQLLMVAGFERYFQIARCFRDEDQRGDRQPEFTQLDLEMSFVDRDDVLRLCEQLMCDLVPATSAKRIQERPFPRLTYKDALARYGSDKPDLRFGLELEDVGDLFAGTDFRLFAGALESGGQIKALRAPGLAEISRREIDALTETARRFGAKGLVTVGITQDGVRSAIARFITPQLRAALLKRLDAVPGDLLLLVADEPAVVAEALGRLRLEIGARLNLADPNVLAFCWIIDVPLFERDEETGGIKAMHHQFTAPLDEDVRLLDSDPLAVRAKQYDLVCNGTELFGGSIRIHQRAVQERIFHLLGMPQEDIAAQFGHMLTAFEFGTPPHGGIAAGLDRIVMLLADEETIREVIPFPKNQSAQDVMGDAPAPVSPEQLAELHISVVRR
ncbi:MAG TPA: aspartate--tRNA ligase [Chloroflexota bacterium]|nr:aspartate--tRNA ligase [Chloroflexota bacterium]